MACTDCEDAETISTTLTAAIAGPAKTSVDGVSVEQHPLTALIEADKYVSAKCASSNSRRGLRFTKLVPPGID